MTELMSPNADALIRIFGPYQVPPSIPQPMVPLRTFQETLQECLEESRRTFVPFSVLLLSVDNVDFGVDSQQHENLLRQLGLYVMSSLRSKHLPEYPSRKLDVISRWDHYFLALCHNTAPSHALHPINRIVSKLESILPSLIGESDTKVRVVHWSWTPKNGHTSELGLLKQLYGRLETISQGGVESIMEPLNVAEAKLLAILEKPERPA